MKTHCQALCPTRSICSSSLRNLSSARWRSTSLFAGAILAWALLSPTTRAQGTQPAAAPPQNSVKTQLDKVNSPGATSPAAGSAASTFLTSTISNVAIMQVSQHASVRVEGDGYFDAQPFRMKKPDRLVFDFARTHLVTQQRMIPDDLPPVHAIRLAQHSSDVVRMIVYLDSPAPYRIVRDGTALVISFEPQVKSSTRKTELSVNPPSPGENTPAESHSPAGSHGKSEPGHPVPIISLETKQSPSPDNSGKTISSGNNSSALGPAISLASADSKPTTQVMTPFGAVDIPQASSAATAQAAQNQNPVTSTLASPPPGSAAQDSSKTQKPPEQPAPTQPSSSAKPAAQQPSSPPEAPPPTVEGAQVAPEDKQSLSVALNLENADLYQVLRIIGSELKINYVVDPSVKGTVTINTSGSISRADLFSVLETILQVNGAAIVKQDGYYRVVPASDARVHPVPLQFAKSPEVPPSPGETLVLQVFPMHFVSASDMGKVLAPFISPIGQVIINDKGHTLLVMETPPKLKQINDILGVFDNPTFSRQRVRLYSVVNNSAKAIITELQDVFGGYSLTGNSAIRFVPIESLNAVLAISPTPEAFADIETWIHQLDQPAQQSGEQNYVYPVQNAKASDLRDILVELYGGSVQKPQPPGSLALNPANPMVPPAALDEAQRAQAPQLPERVQGRIHIMSDEKNNSLIIQASPHDYEIIKHTLVQLDLLPRQVLVDAQIYSVDLTGNLSLGISYYLNQQSQLPGPLPLSSSGSFAAGQSPGSLLGATFAILSHTQALQIFLNATDQRGRVKVLSAPSILVTDNTSARIQVGSSVPVPIGSSLTPVQSNGSSVFAQTIQYQDTGVILTVTPHINASGVVTLTLTQEVSSAVANSTSGIVAPVINKSSFQTNVVLADGEPLALGGIIVTTNSLSRDRIPILGEIPYAGALFGTTTRKTERNEIVLILTPHVLQNLPQAAAQSQAFIDKMRETKKEIDKAN